MAECLAKSMISNGNFSNIFSDLSQMTLKLGSNIRWIGVLFLQVLIFLHIYLPARCLRKVRRLIKNKTKAVCSILKNYFVLDWCDINLDLGISFLKIGQIFEFKFLATNKPINSFYIYKGDEWLIKHLYLEHLIPAKRLTVWGHNFRPGLFTECLVSLEKKAGRPADWNLSLNTQLNQNYRNWLVWTFKVRSTYVCN